MVSLSLFGSSRKGRLLSIMSVIKIILLWFKMFYSPCSFIFYNYFSSSATFSFSFLITPLEKCALLANSSSTSLWMFNYWVSFFIWFCIYSSLKINFSVCFDWYSNSLVNWWFWRIVSRVVVSSCYFFSDRRLVCISLIFFSISGIFKKNTIP